MTEAVAIQLLHLLIVAFPPLAQLLSRLLPYDDSDPLVWRIRAMLPVEGASAAAVRELTRPFGAIEDIAGEDEP